MLGMNDQKLPLSIYLLRPDRVDAFKQKLLDGSQLVLPLSKPFDGFVLPLKNRENTPDWVTVLKSALENPGGLLLTSQSAGALMFLNHAGKSFVLSFGYGWRKLEDEWLELDFGRRVALNSIDPDKIVEMQSEQVFAKWHRSSERAPRASRIDEFSVESDRDLVATVEGLSSVKLFGKIVRGGTNLHFEVPFAKLDSVLTKAISLFASHAYQNRWPEVDNVSPVKDQSLIDKLEVRLDAELAAGTAQPKMVMFTPTYRRVESVPVDSYVFGRLTDGAATTPYLMVDSWTNFLARKGRKPSVAEARATPIHLLGDAKEEMSSCDAFDCFGYEMGLDGRQYILSSGVWYEVVVEFLKKINNAASTIAGPGVTLPAWDGSESEPEYNLRCGKRPGFLHFDTKNIYYGGNQSKFEFCDLLHMKSKTLYFAKIASKSSGMSHLVEQVRRTAELLFSTDGTYRQELIKIFKKQHKGEDTEWLKSKPRNSDWNLCLVSLGKSTAQLPFFARCSVVKLYKDLRERGHEVSFLKV